MYSKSNFREINRLLLLVTLFCCFCGHIQAQNLISNPTFINSAMKETVHYPSELMRNPAVPEQWEMVVGYPDFFNNSSSTYLGYPILNTDQGTGGKLGMRMTTSNNESEAVETKLSQALVKGERYKVSFTMAQCHYSNYSMGMIPFILSNEHVTRDNILQNVTQNLCVLETSKDYLAKDGWVTVSFIYEAKGGENYFTLINNSYTSSEQEKSKFNLLRFDYTGNQLAGSSYYFFENISLEATSDTTECPSFSLNSDPKTLENLPLNEFQTKLQILSKFGLVELNENKLNKENLLNAHVIFLIDISGSMKTVLPSLKFQLLDILNKIPNDQLVSLVEFSDRSHILFNRVNKESLINSLNNLYGDGETNITAGYRDMSSLIDPKEMTILEVFTDEKTNIMSYLEQERPKQFRNTKNMEDYLEYESILTSEISEHIINDSTDQRIIKHIYESKAPNAYFDFKSGNLKEFQYSKECTSTAQNNIVAEERGDLEKLTNNVYLIDVSSSMSEGNKLPQLKNSLLAYNESLSDDNRVSLVTFSSTIDVLLNSIKPNDALFKEKIQHLEGKGWTKIDDGIKFMYSHYKNTNHQNLSFVLFTDGEFTLSKASEKIILENQDIHLTIFQFGDKKSRQLAALTEAEKLNYKKINPKDIQSEL
ncbi:MAG: VWA domain-containing protein, partial [Crocinitomicaceae bacterium]